MIIADNDYNDDSIDNNDGINVDDDGSIADRAGIMVKTGRMGMESTNFSMLRNCIGITSSLTGSLLWVSFTDTNSSFSSSAATTKTTINVSRRNPEKKPV